MTFNSNKYENSHGSNYLESLSAPKIEEVGKLTNIILLSLYILKFIMLMII